MTRIALQASPESVRGRDVVRGVIAGAIGGTVSFALLVPAIALLFDLWILPLALVGLARLVEGSSVMSARLLVSVAVAWYTLLSVGVLLYQFSSL